MIPILSIALLTFFILYSIFIKKIKYDIWIVFILGIFLRAYNASFLFLHSWDEKFHALVAKNLITSPFEPILINDKILNLKPENWWMNEVWLSKPPLALWLLSSSMSIFGVNELGLRLPSIILSSMSIYLTFLIGRNLYDEKIGVLGSFLYAINGLLIMVNSGQLSSDHIETLFLLFIQIAFYFSIKYIHKYRQKYLHLTGIVLGMSLMCKWYMGFVIYFFFLSILLWHKASFKKIIYSSIIILVYGFCFLGAWIAWLFYKYPADSHHFFNHFLTPLFQSIHGHRGNMFFYLYKSMIHVHEFYLIILLFFVYTWKVKKINHHDKLLLYISLTTLILLSIASTKREVYLMVASFVFCIQIARFCMLVFNTYLVGKFGKLIQVTFMVLLLGLPLRYCIERIKPFEEKFVKPEWRMCFENFISDHKINEIVIINDPHYIETRFYYDIKSYPYLEINDIQKIKSKGYRIFSYDLNQNTILEVVDL